MGKTEKILGLAGETILNGATGGLASGVGSFISGLFGDDSEKKQFENEKELMGLQAKYNEAAASNNQKRAQAMWDYTNYENQKKHMIQAGLNPALLYGMSGGGGSSASGAGQAAGVSNPGTQAVMMGIQAENMRANTQLQKAEAAKATAEAAKTSGTDTEESQSRIGLNETLKEMNRTLSRLQETNTRLSEAQIETERAKQEDLYAKATESAMNAIKTNIEGQLKEKELNNWDEAFAKNIAVQTSIIAKNYSDVSLNNQKIKNLEAEINKWINDVRVNWKEAETHRADVINRCNQWMNELGIKERGLRQQLFGMFIEAATGGIATAGKLKGAREIANRPAGKGITINVPGGKK